MTSTGTKVIAFELGLIIAILTWIAYDGLPWAKPQKPLVIPEITDQSVGFISPNYQLAQRQGEPVDYPADDPGADQWRAQGDVVSGAQYADQSVATSGYVQPGAVLFQPGGPADTIGIFPEPVLWDDCYYPSSYGTEYNPQSQVIVVSNSRSFARGHEVMRHRNSPRRMSPGRLTTRRQTARFAPRMQSRRVLPRARALSYGHVTRQRAASFSGPGRIAPGRAATAQNSRVVQGRRSHPQR
ncbi:MAG: hypothetical protein ABI674_04985 [Spartobacteria bacterium]